MYSYVNSFFFLLKEKLKGRNVVYFIMFNNTFYYTIPFGFRCLDYIASPGIVIPLIVLMILIIYYMISLTGSLREANNDLKVIIDSLLILFIKKTY